MKNLTLPAMNLTRLAAVITLSVLALFTSITAASAHDELVSSTPKDGASLKTAPKELVLTFSGELQTISGVDSTKVVLKQDGTVVDAKAETKGTTVTVTPAEELGNGEYDLAFRVVSSDGHPVENNLGFTIKNDAKPTPSMISAPSDSAAPTDSAAPSESASSSETPMQDAGRSMSPIMWVVIGVVILGGVIGVMAKFMRNTK
ncbi:copper resistance protein CopC [Glutamicibacter sp. JL.03c]|uniref:copper resistance CopC family protein n=1 Tax=Glutamicibacter sp. JL.03c TaxID=2984842 RepID=UPI0021F7DE96|nr:copper resistance CopC family protein [Glutamicibacter sp. JL.03c]UYQ76787.1 copper resistance protein CopC [Glutamicibacter sp. JL.03c]